MQMAESRRNEREANYTDTGIHHTGFEIETSNGYLL